MELDSGGVTLLSMATAAAITFLSSGELADLLATVIQGVAGGTKAGWRKAIGPVERLPTWQYVRFNWRVNPTGSPAQRETIKRAVEVVRAEHPYID